MSTDTAFALGALALVGSGVPDRVRTYLLTFALVDDVAGIAVIALAYSGRINLAALGVGLAILGVVIVVRQRGAGTAPPICCSAWRPGSRSSNTASTRWWSAWQWVCSRSPTRPRVATWSRRRRRSGCSASSRPRNWPEARERACGWRFRRTTGSSSCSIPGPAT